MVADLRALAAGLNVRVTAEVSRSWKEKPAKSVGPLVKRLAVAVLLLALVGALGAAAWTWRGRIAALFAGDKADPQPRPRRHAVSDDRWRAGPGLFRRGLRRGSRRQARRSPGADGRRATVDRRVARAVHGRTGVARRRGGGAARDDTAGPLLAARVRRTGRRDDRPGDLEPERLPGAAPGVGGGSGDRPAGGRQAAPPDPDGQPLGARAGEAGRSRRLRPVSAGTCGWPSRPHARRCALSPGDRHGPEAGRSARGPVRGAVLRSPRCRERR